MERAVLAYAGGFDVAAAIDLLKAETGAEVIVVTMDLGQGYVLEDLRDRALAAGAARAHVLDLRETFAANYVLPSLKADATAADGVPMAAALGRALVADKLVEMAGIEQAGAVAHGGASTAGASALAAAIHALNPSLKVVTVPPSAGVNTQSGHALRSNLWGVYGSTRAPRALPAEAAAVEIRFERGVPGSVNGVPMPLVELISTLAHLAGAHRIGRIDTPEAVLDAPAAVVLHTAHRELQKRKAPPKDGDALSRQYADIIAMGQWPTPARGVLDKTIEKSQKRVNGLVKMKLFQGECQLVDL
jgi:argininosuccinate synthase